MSDSDCEEEHITAPKHWGEIPESPTENDDILPDVSEDIRKSMQKDCLDIYPDDDAIMQIKDINLLPPDPLIMYAIQLHKWMNNMTETIRLAEVAIENNLIPPEDAPLPIPEMPEISQQAKHTDLVFMAIKPPGESEPLEVNIPELSDIIVKQILVKCVAVMTAHIGFEDSFQSVLDVLVDVLEQFFVKFCDRFVSALNEEETLDTSGFSNALERVLVETGFGGAKGLQDYYRCRVVKYISVLQKRCQELEHQYSSLIIPRNDSPTGEIGKCFGIRVKQEAPMETDSEMGYNGEDLITTEDQLSNQLFSNVQSTVDS